MQRYRLYDPSEMQPRWLAYFDLLGIKALIAQGKMFRVHESYAKALEEIERHKSDFDYLESISFSDTFLIFSKDGTGPSYAAVESAARWFAHFLLVDGIPLRGAVACGPFFASREDSIYFGQALVEAYEYGEAQDWIGFVLTPSATKRLGELGGLYENGENLNFARWRIPYKEHHAPHLEPELLACILDQWIEIDGRNMCVDALERMKRTAGPQHATKYQNALDFFTAKRRTVALGR